ncbi:MAG: lytic transglycosylase domain-containing protein, partial [Saprospiraceae bacterium]
VTAFLMIVVLSSYDTIGPQLDPLFQQRQALKTTNYGPQNVRAIKMPSHIEFAYERVPLENFDVKERLDKELLRNTFYHSHMFRYLKLSRRYFPTIERILAEQGVPNDFKYLAVAESSLLYNATSRSGAQGLWQFMPSTAKSFGLEITSEIDERNDLEKATRKACEHLKADYKRFGSWTIAAAAYNTGAGRLRKKIENQKTKNYYDLELRKETSDYMFRILAIKEIMQRREQYGIIVNQYYKELSNYKTLEISGSIPNLAQFAIDNGTTLRKFRLYNPWLISDKLTNSKRKVYQIRIPQE